MLSNLLVGKSKDDINKIIGNYDIDEQLSKAVEHGLTDIIDDIKKDKMPELIDAINDKSEYYKMTYLSKVGLTELFKEEVEMIDMDDYDFYYEGFAELLNECMGNSIRNNHAELAKYIITMETFGSVIINDHTWLSMAAEYGCLEIVEFLLPYYDNERKRYEAIYNAYKRGKKDIVKFLLPHVKLDKNDEEKFKSIL